MKVAKLRIFWDKSPSTDVVEYSVLVVNEDTQEVIGDRVVSFAETQVVVEVEPNTNVTATIVASDGLFSSKPVSASYAVGDLTAPEPVGFVGFDLMEVVELEDEEVPVDTVEGGEFDNGEGDEVA